MKRNSSKSASVGSIVETKNRRKRIYACDDLVGVAGVEPTASWTRTKRATNCATPRKLYVILMRGIHRKPARRKCATTEAVLRYQAAVTQQSCRQPLDNCATPRKQCVVLYGIPIQLFYYTELLSGCQGYIPESKGINCQRIKVKGGSA